MGQTSNFDQMLIICVIISIMFIFVTGFVLYRRGIDISQNKVSIRIFLVSAAINIIPFCLDKSLPLTFKIIVPTVLTIFGFFYMLGLKSIGSKFGKIVKPPKKESE
jgi:hypothetical protein